jgi:hypothetical protein
MPIVKCMACGKMGFAVAGKAGKDGRLGTPWNKQPCGRCGAPKLVRAVFGVDYGFKDGGGRYGVPGFTVHG